MSVIDEIKSTDHKTWYNYGISRSRQGRFDNAVASYDKAIEIKPDYYEAWSNRGKVLSKLGKYRSSVKSYDNQK